MSTLRVNSLADVAGNASSFGILGVARAWVNFNGTGTVAIRASLNVSSITDNGVGNYTVNFTTALADANYSAVACGGETAGTVGLAAATGAFAAGTLQVYTKNTSTALVDFTNVCVAVYR